MGVRPAGVEAKNDPQSREAMEAVALSCVHQAGVREDRWVLISEARAVARGRGEKDVASMMPSLISALIVHGKVESQMRAGLEVVRLRNVRHAT